MRRAWIVIIGLALACAAVVVVIRMRVEGKIVLPSEKPLAVAKEVPDSSAVPVPPVKKGMAKEVAAPAAGPEGEPPPAETDGPPEGFLWWGGDTIRKEARIPILHHDYGHWWGYDAPVSYTSDGKLVVASKYGDHSSCIWCYDSTTNEFSVLYPKTRWLVWNLGGDTPRHISWVESSKEYRWDSRQEMTRNVRIARESKNATLRGNRKGDECYGMRGTGAYETTGLVFKTTANKQPETYPLNSGALELVKEQYSTQVSIPFINRPFLNQRYSTLSVRDTTSDRVVSSLALGDQDFLSWVQDYGRGLALMLVWSKQGNPQQPPEGHIVLARYPELRVIGCGTLPRPGAIAGFLPTASLKDGLATDIISFDQAGNWATKGGSDGRTALPSSGNPILCRVRVPQGWREAPGRVRQNLLWENDTSGCLDLDISEAGVFDLAKWDAHWGSEVEGDPFPENINHSYAWRDGVMFWRKRHTGEVVMAEPTNLSRQVVIGGEGTVWDGFRLNPIRDEMVTWRENGELVFWNAQFPEATPLVQTRVITDETPHRLEAM